MRKPKSSAKLNLETYAKLNDVKKSYVTNDRLEKARSKAREMPAFKELPEQESLFTEYSGSVPIIRTGKDQVSFGLDSSGTVRIVPQDPNTITVNLARAKAATPDLKKLQQRIRPLTLGLSIGRADPSA